MRDANGLTYLRVRYLDSSTGRFINRNTWGGDYNRPLSLNRWGYVEGNPINFVDPTGHYPAPSTGHLAVPAQSHLFSMLGRTLSPDILSSAFACSTFFNDYGSYASILNFAFTPEDFWDRYVQGWENFDSAWSILTHPNATGYEKIFASSYLTTWGGAHGLLGLGTGMLACSAIGPSCITAAETLLGIGTAAAGAVGDPTYEIQAINTGTNVVYRLLENGVTKYIGITNDFSRRQAEHLAQRGWLIERIPGLNNLIRTDTHAVEQVLIDLYELPNLYNKINSIAASNPIYLEAIQRGEEILRAIGFLR
ncbi:MAG: hypothetical protein K8R40_13805 [Anaerolineaceae bacterium]|nr:hypothetical protein [Anaerolineaceae bacterium]